MSTRYAGGPLDIVRIIELIEETAEPTQDLYMPIDSDDYTLHPKRISKYLLATILEKIMGMIKVEKSIRCLVKDSPITHKFLGDPFPGGNYKLSVKCVTDDGYYFEPVIVEEYTDGFKFEIEQDCTMEYSALYAPLPTGS
jgi:hypothetical protein